MRNMAESKEKGKLLKKLVSLDNTYFDIETIHDGLFLKLMSAGATDEEILDASLKSGCEDGKEAIETTIKGTRLYWTKYGWRNAKHD